MRVTVVYIGDLFALKLLAFSFILGLADYVFGVAGPEVEMQLGDMRSTRHLQQADLSGAVRPITAETPGEKNVSGSEAKTHHGDG